MKVRHCGFTTRQDHQCYTIPQTLVCKKFCLSSCFALEQGNMPVAQSANKPFEQWAQDLCLWSYQSAALARSSQHISADNAAFSIPWILLLLQKLFHRDAKGSVVTWEVLEWPAFPKLGIFQPDLRYLSEVRDGTGWVYWTGIRSKQLEILNHYFLESVFLFRFASMGLVRNVS